MKDKKYQRVNKKIIHTKEFIHGFFKTKENLEKDLHRTISERRIITSDNDINNVFRINNR